jgi:hypothetical protein
LCARVRAGVPDSGILCFVTAFTQRYECLCQLSLEGSFNNVQDYLIFYTFCWLYCV